VLIAALGEGMLELRGALGAAQLGYGGDVLNTAVYMARLGLRPHFVSALGADPYSEQLRAAWVDEGVDAGDVLVHRDRLPGLYAVITDARAERSFFYWRSEAAARDFFALPGAEAALGRLADADLFYLSLITLSIFNPAERARIVELARAVRARGGTVAFDANYRARGWDSPAIARAAVEAIGPHVSIALPSLEDSAALFAATDGQAAARKWRDLGAGEAIVKCGGEDMIVLADGAIVAVPARRVARPVDTTGAGDAFNAAYLAARCARGRTARDAADAGAELAALVISYPGAIIPRAAMTKGGA
jgi:2-dehydro-3-deoxygluconokinase